MKTTLLIPIVFAIVSYGCGQSPKDSADTNKPITDKKKVEAPIAKNKSLDEVVYRFPKEGCPVVLFFDAQAGGSQFLNRYGDMFSSLGMGVVTSNIYRNGITGEEAGRILEQMIQTAQQNGADMEQLYLMGFSGGGKFVQNLAEVIPNVKAVVTFGIGKNMQVQNKVPEINILGINDLNFSQAMMYPFNGKYGKPDLIILHDGGHEWPPVNILEYSLNYCLSGFNQSDLTLPIQKTELVNNLNHTLHSFSPSNGAEALQKLKNELGKQLAREREWMIRVQKMYQSQNEADWKNILQKLEEIEPDAHIKARVEGYLSMVNYILTSNYIQAGKYEKGRKQLNLYQMVDPDNPDVRLLMALILANKGEYKSAVTAINEAINMGFTGYQKLMFMKFPNELSQREDFVLTLEKIYPD